MRNVQMIVRRSVTLIGLSLAMNSVAQAANLSLASPFTDHAVLQRDQKLAVWGMAAPNAAVTVSLNGKEAHAKSDSSGQWMATLEPLQAGGPFVMHVSAGKEAADVKDLLIGDVWLCSGQSNMQMSLHEVINAPAEIATTSSHPQMRLLRLKNAASGKPETKFEGAWTACTPETASEFSAVGYLFGHELSKSPKLANVPIGLIDSAFGGTVVEGWIPAEQVSKYPKDELRGSMFGIGTSALYNAMIAPLVPYNLKGAVWYQGEGNAGHPQPYAQLLTTMITTWRDLWHSPDMPFLIVELPPNNGDWGGYYFTWIRDAERKVAQTVPHVALATTVNTHDGSDLHPKEKHEIGTRLALLARHDVYGESSLVARGPVFKSAKVEGSSIKVKFDTNGSALKTLNGDPILKGFSVAGDDHVYRYATAKIEGDDTVVVQSDQIAQPKTVRYAWSPIPVADLYNVAGLPAAPFRSDNFPVERLIEILPQPTPRRVDTGNYELTVDGGGRVISFAVKGQQLISSAPGINGGTTIPVMFGYKQLQTVTPLGPSSIKYSDNDTAITFNFNSTDTTWTIRNSGGNDENFRIACAPQVEVKRDDKVVTLHRGNASLALEGIEVFNKTDEGGNLLEVKVPAKGEATLKFTVKE